MFPRRRGQQSRTQRYFDFGLAAMIASAVGGGMSAFGKKKTGIQTGSSLSGTQKKLFKGLAGMAQEGIDQPFRPYAGATQRLAPNANEQAVFNRIPELLAQSGRGKGMMSQAMQTAGKPPNAQGTQPGTAEEPSIAEIIHKGQTSIISKILQAVQVGR
jgi:hypothetical protein